MKYFKKYNLYITKLGIFSFLSFISFYTYAFAVGTSTPSTPTSGQTFREVVTEFILKAGTYILTLLVALTVLMFLYGLARYMFKGQGSDTARSEGRKLMLWGIIGIFVMTSVWGLVAILASTIGHTSTLVPQFSSSPVNK
jgi:Type IV secretion system pilin